MLKVYPNSLALTLVVLVISVENSYSLPGNHRNVDVSLPPGQNSTLRNIGVPPRANVSTDDTKSWENFLEHLSFQDLSGIFKRLPKTSFNNTRKVITALLQPGMLSTLRRVLSQRPASDWFPQGPGVGYACYHHLMAYFDGLIGRQVSASTGTDGSSDGDELASEEWALQMFDSVGKPSSGLLVGRLQLIGDYDQCIKVRATSGSGTHSIPVAAGTHSETRQLLFGGRYCRVRMPMEEYVERRLPENVNTFWLDDDHMPININWGICVPDTCSEGDINAFLTQGTFNTFNLRLDEVLCFEDPKLREDAGAVFVILLLTVFALAVAVCTVVDVYNIIKDSKPPPDSTCWCLGQGTATSTDNISSDKVSGPETSDRKQEAVNKTNHQQVAKGNDHRQSDGHGSSNPDLLKETAILNEGGATTDVGETGECSINEQQNKANTTRILDDANTELSKAKGLCRDDTEKLKGISNDAFEMTDLGGKKHEKQATCPAEENCVKHEGHSPGETEGKNLTIDMEEQSCKDDRAGQEKIDTRNGDGITTKPSESLGGHIVKGMSLYTNFLQFMNTDVSSTKPTIRCVEGLKAITMAWVLLGHTYTFGGIIDENNIIYDNALEMINIPDRLAFHIVGSAQFGVDTFFVICGCLVMFISLDKLKSVPQKWQFWTCFVFRRFWRLTPIYMVVLAVGTNLYDHIVYGPLKAHNLEEFHECRDKWWAHLLYINNFYRPTQKCMTWTWYLAVDMQLHVLSPLLIYPVYRNRRMGATLIILLMAGGMISAFVSELAYGGQFLLMDMNFVDYWSHVYTVPWARVSAFAIGLLLGVVLRDLNTKPQAWEMFLRRKWCQRLLSPVMWTLSLGVGVCLALLNHRQWMHGTGHWGRPALAVFESLSRPLWSLAVAWVIFACNTGRAGPVAKILSWPPFVVLSRLSYSVYLLHPLVILFVVYSRRTAIYLHPNRIDQMYNYLGNLILTHLFAVVLYLLVEAPLRSLDILWEPRRRRKTA